jgi:hypothetical protein
MIMKEEGEEDEDDEEYSLHRGGKGKGKKHHDKEEEEDDIRASVLRDKKKKNEILDEITENRKKKKMKNKNSDSEEDSDEESDKKGKSKKDDPEKKQKKKGGGEEETSDNEEKKKKKIIPTDEITKGLFEENERLKKEMKAYDSNFFEEINDLKYRYTRLQEIIGEDPYLDNSISSSLNSRHPGAAGGRSLSPTGRRVADLPLNRLSWSTRNSMRAIDHANISSPLVRGRRNIEKELYLGGGGGVDGRDSRERHSRSLSPSFLSSSAKDSLLLPTRLSSTGSSVIYDGGIHGIGEGRHFLGENNDIGGGSFSNLCERRLVFELSSHSNPAEATSLLIHQ